MNRREAIEAYVAVRDGAPTITGPGATSGTLWSFGHDPATIYNMELGYATAMCLGIALATPDQRVVSIEGDGSLIAGMTTLTSIARHRPPNLVVIVLDNGIYATGVGFGEGITEETAASHGTRIDAVAVACGMPTDLVIRVDDVGAFTAAIGHAMIEPGPWLIVADIDTSDATGNPNRRRADVDVVETAGMLKREMVRRGYGAPRTP